MTNIGFVYFGDKYIDEESYISGTFTCYRAKDFSVTPDITHEIYASDYVLTRGPKLSQFEYEKCWSIWNERGLTFASSPTSYLIANSPQKNTALLCEDAPELFVLSANLTDEEIVRTLINKAIHPLFVRSEKESAAKYVGVDGCIISALDDESILSAVRDLRTHVLGFNEIIFKRVVSIAKSSSGKVLEYRGIAVKGVLVSIEYDTSLPSPKSLGIDIYAANIIIKLAQHGLDGAFFIDIGVKNDGGFFVIECKDLINGKIHTITRFSQGLKNLLM